MVRGYKLRITAIGLLINFVSQLIFPTVSLALTGGPSQPEVNSFEPMGTTQMVDVYSGDFNYNIPLLNIPGSNGSYPINIAYHAGVGMEQEASWVGLGWNINPGAVVRDMRGLPDDFNGDEITKEFTIKPDFTIGINKGLGVEFFGADPSTTLNMSLYYNSYRGIGYSVGANFSSIFHNTIANSKESKNMLGLNFGASLSFDSQGGMSASPNIGLSSEGSKILNNVSLSGNINSIQGLTSLNVHKNISNDNPTVIKARGAGFSITNPGYIPSIQNSMWSQSYQGEITLGGKVPVAFLKGKTGFSYSTTYVKDKTKKVKGYGLIHQEGATGEDDIMDFNRENDGAITKNSPYTPLPVRTNDMYSIQGQGIGGSFRAFRSDIGHLKDEKNISQGITGSVGYEGGVGSLAHVGAGASFGYSKSYSGPWKENNHSISQLDNYKSKSEPATTSKFEKFYFKSNGESTSSSYNEIDRIGGDKPVAFDLALHWEGIGVKPKVKNIQYNGDPVNIKDKAEREKRNQLIEYYTAGELEKTTSTIKSHHIYQVNVLNPDGNRYVYGEPAYNNIQKEVSFSVDSVSSLGVAYSSNPKLVAYTEGLDNTLNNNKGQDHFYSSTTLPGYAHSYMLTSIQSNDYVDLTLDGETEDDFGFWTKFKYSTVTNYKWRFPYEENYANYNRGYYSNLQDDKANYVYGEKNLKYIDTIETNTHFAVFSLGDRADGISVVDENGGRDLVSPVKQKYLKSITLYSKENPTVPIKKVHFEYDYSLCTGIPSNDGTTGENIQANQGGKLTLKKIYFTNLKSTKGKLTPYVFSYEGLNPSYSPLNVDRWGNYQPNQGSYINYAENPYTRQDSTLVNSYASAWNLTTIKMPSGSTIKVTYESDDYLYVQDKLSMEMFEIVGTSDVNGEYVSGSMNLSDENVRLYFKTEKPLTTNEEVGQLIAGIENLYFKTFLDLKTVGSKTFKDYITGYAPVLKTAGSYGKVTGQSNMGYLTLGKVNHKGKSGGLYEVNPIQLAGWQSMRYERADLSLQVNEGLGVIENNIIKIVQEAISLFGGYYNKCKVLGYCNKISSSTNQKSYIRLNSVKKKYGGGHRVKKIEIESPWQGSTEVYGQEYSYSNKDNTSSGVAEYEPLAGGDEISLRQPKYFDNKRSLLFTNTDFKQEPFGESYFPGAKVGYGRVVVSNLKNNNVNKAQTGISVNEFFTSKDFPVIVKKAKETPEHVGYNLPIFIPFIGAQSFQNNGYSNGYSIILNDMPGKPKATSTFPYGSDLNSNPVSSTVYNYQYKPTTNKDGEVVNELYNTVKVADAQGVTRLAKIGESYDFYIDQSEHSTISTTLGLNVNLDLEVFFPMPSAYPSLEYNQSLYRHVITNKVIYRNGVLKSVENTTDGSKVVATNELYDAETGEVLLTSSNNEHEKEIYNYSLPAHWAYDRMGGAYENYRAVVKLNEVGTDTQEYELVPNTLKVGDYFKLGDKVVSKSNNILYGWVVEIDEIANTVHIEDEDNYTGSFPANHLCYISKSGNANMQSVQNGSIVSFENPSTYSNDFNSGFLWTYKLLNEGFDEGYSTDFAKDYCGETFYTSFSHTDFPNILSPPCDEFGNEVNYTSVVTFMITTESSTFNCARRVVPVHTNSITDELDDDLSNYRFDLSSYRLMPSDPSYYLIDIEYIGPKKNSVNRWTRKGLLGQENICIYNCEENIYPVLQASYTEYTDTGWYYNYADANYPTIYNGDTLAYTSSINEYAFGQKGIWRPKRTWAYQKDRKQSGSKGVNTRTDKDGEFDFILFKPEESINGNDTWTWTNEITKYSPYGFQLENKNPLGIYSSELYGYNNTVVTATTANAKYEEIAFDGFETGNSNPTYGVFYDHITDGHMFNAGNVYGILPENMTAFENENFTHTGFYSLTTHNLDNYIPNVTFTPNNKYLMSVWVKSEKLTGEKVHGQIIELIDGDQNPTITIDSNTVNSIDGWFKVDIVFKPSGSLLSGVNFMENLLFDDIRIQPFNSSMKTYVYDPRTLWLIAELDEQNYATFYNYDQEGNLIQVKKETERGIFTIKSTRNNTAH